MAQLLARDSVYGRFGEPVRTGADTLLVGDRAIRALHERDPSSLPWAELGVDVVIESTGRFRTRAQAARRLDKDMRRARAAAVNLVPTSTVAAKALGLVVPGLEGRLNGFAVRVPIPTGWIVDLTIEAERPTTVAEINAAFAERSAGATLAGILQYSEEPLVSSDIVGSPYSAIYDAPLTSVIDGTQVKVVAWYDNEWGYANRLVELAERVMAPVPAAVAVGV